MGCVIVKDNIVVGRGWTQTGGRPHAAAKPGRSCTSGAPGRRENRPLPMSARCGVSASQPKGEKPQLPATCVAMPCSRNGAK